MTFTSANYEKIDRMKPPSMNANNQDLFVWSLFLLNGGSEWVDVEDIYLKSFELAPERLSWRTRRDIPDYKKCAKALQSVEAPGKNHEGMLVKKSEHERKLSTKGLEWCNTYAELLKGVYEGERVQTQATHEAARRVRQVLNFGPFIEFSETGQLNFEPWELADLLRCAVDSSSDIWQARLAVFAEASIFENNKEVQTFVTAIQEWLAKGESNG